MGVEDRAEDQVREAEQYLEDVSIAKPMRPPKTPNDDKAIPPILRARSERSFVGRDTSSTSVGTGIHPSEGAPVLAVPSVGTLTGWAAILAGDREPSLETYRRISERYGWPQTFASSR